MTSERGVNADWIPPLLPELEVIERDGRWLCLNPRVPAWIVTQRPGALLLQMIDGESSVSDYERLLAAHGIPTGAVGEFFAAAAAAKLFDPASSIERRTPWPDRKLTALYVHLTNRCNLQCSYCYRESSPHLPILHDAGRFSAMFEFVKPFAAPRLEITFSGGEPTMHPGFRSVVETSSRLGYRNLLLTNATRLDADLLPFVREHFRLVKISLDGPNEEIHSRTRGKGNFDRVIRSIEKLVALGANVLVQVTLSKSALTFVRDIRAILPEAPNLKLVYTPLFTMGRGAELAPEAPDNDDFYAFAKIQGSKRRYVPGQPSRSCHAAAGSLSIAETGDVYPCHLFHFEPFRLGNIFHDPFEQIFFSDRAREFVGAMDVEANNPTCADCSVRLLCSGGCHGNTLYSIGSFRGPDSCCDYLKRSIVDNLFTPPAQDQTSFQTSL